MQRIANAQPADTLDLMAVRGTPGRVIRVEQELWEAYGEVCASDGTTRADDLRRHMTTRVKEYRAEQRRIAAEERAAES